MEGSWQLEKYEEFIHDASSQLHEIIEGEAYFEPDGKGKEKLNFGIYFHAVYKTDTIRDQYSGCYRVTEGRQLELQMLKDTVIAEFDHSSKNHLVFRTTFKPNRSSLVYVRKN